MTLVTFIATESALVVILLYYTVSLKYDKSKYCNVAIFIMAIGIFILQMVQAWYILLNACSICTMKIPSTTMMIALSYIYVSYTYIYVLQACCKLLTLCFL
jgi:hypothetical protein